MSNDNKIYFSREEQVFLMEMFETQDPSVAAERFATMLVEERANPSDLKKYLSRIIKKYLEKFPKK